MSLLLLFMMISVNYIGDTLNCSLQHIMINSRMFKLLIVFFVLFIFIMIVNPEYKNQNPFDTLKVTVPIFLIYVLSTKNNPLPLFTFLTLWFIIYFLYLYKNYKFNNIYFNVNNKYKYRYITKIDKIKLEKLNKKIDKNSLNLYIIITNTQYILFVISIIVLILGFCHYYYLKGLEYKKNGVILILY